MRHQRPDRGTPRVVPIAAERLRVDRRRVTVGRVRVTKKTRQRDVLVDEPVVTEDVVVRRVPVGRFVDGPVPDRYVDGRLIVSVLEEGRSQNRPTLALTNDPRSPLASIYS